MRIYKVQMPDGGPGRLPEEKWQTTAKMLVHLGGVAAYLFLLYLMIRVGYQVTAFILEGG